jgi:hypothetical protein
VLLLALLIVWIAIPVSFLTFGSSAYAVAGLPWPVAVCALAFGGVMLLLAQLKCPACGDSLFGVLDEVGFSRDLDATRQCPYCQADFTQPAVANG